MAKKTFYIDLEKQKFNETMIVNKHISFNHMVRKPSVKDQIQLFDNHSGVSNVLVKKKVKRGQSLHLNKLQLQHQNDDKVRFQLNIASKVHGLSNQNYFDSFLNIFKNLANKPNKKYPVVILRPTKGGYLGYSFGIIGHIPRDQYLLGRKFYFSCPTALAKRKLALFYIRKTKLLDSSQKMRVSILKKIPHRLPFILLSTNESINESNSNFSERDQEVGEEVEINESDINFIFIFDQKQVELHRKKKEEKLENSKEEILPKTKTYEQKQKNKEQSRKEYFRKLQSKPTTKKKSLYSNHLSKSDNGQRSA